MTMNVVHFSLQMRYWKLSITSFMNVRNAGQGAHITFSKSRARLEDILPRGMVAAMPGQGASGTPLPPPTSMFEPIDVSAFMPDSPATILGYVDKNTEIFRGNSHPLYQMFRYLLRRTSSTRMCLFSLSS